MENTVAKIEPQKAQAVAPITPMDMLQMAVAQNADLDRLEKLMELQIRWEANEAKKAYIVAKATFKAEAPTIGKNKHVGFSAKNGGAKTDYDHATLDNVADTLSPILSKHGLSYGWETEQLDGGIIRVTCILTHVSGHSERNSLQAGPDQSGNKNNIQAVCSTVTYLQRYTLLSITGTATGDMDNDGAGAGDLLITEDQKNQIIEKMKEVNADTTAFLKYLDIPVLDALTAGRFADAMKALEAKRKKS